MGHMAPIKAGLGYVRAELGGWCVNSELELVRLWLEAVVLEPDSRFCFNDTAELGWCGRERREVIPGSSLVIIECILHFWHHLNSCDRARLSFYHYMLSAVYFYTSTSV